MEYTISAPMPKNHIIEQSDSTAKLISTIFQIVFVDFSEKSGSFFHGGILSGLPVDFSSLIVYNDNIRFMTVFCRKLRHIGGILWSS